MIEKPFVTSSAPTSRHRLALLMDTFDVSIGEIARLSGRAISKTQIHRVLAGKRPSPRERQAIAAGLLACLRSRCDSAYLFEEPDETTIGVGANVRGVP
jgi:hypothetical protein